MRKNKMLATLVSLGILLAGAGRSEAYTSARILKYIDVVINALIGTAGLKVAVVGKNKSEAQKGDESSGVGEVGMRIGGAMVSYLGFSNAVERFYEARAFSNLAKNDKKIENIEKTLDKFERRLDNQVGPS